MLRLAKLDSKDQDERIFAILCPDKLLDVEEYFFSLPRFSAKTLARYYDFLKFQLQEGFTITGREDIGYFGYEEPYNWGGGSKAEYESPAETRASLEDKFEWLHLVDWNLEYGLMAEVKRIKDGKQFIIPLVDLEVCLQKIKEYNLVEDYSSWFVNFGPES
jgi:hypothetical protein